MRARRDIAIAGISAVAVALALAACSLVVDTSGLTGGSGRADATTGDGASTDGPAIDGGGGDTTGAQDAPTEASASYCGSVAPKPAFCDDFDEDQTPFGWSSTIDPGGTLGLDDAASTSPPSSLHSTMQSFAASPCRYANEKITNPITYTTRIRLAFDLRPGHLTGSGGFSSGSAMNELGLFSPGGTGYCGFYFDFSPTASSLNVEGAATKSFGLSTGPSEGKWSHVELVIENATAAVTIDGAPVLAASAIPAGCEYGKLRYLGLGLLCVSPNAGDFDVHVDNVAIWTD